MKDSKRNYKASIQTKKNITGRFVIGELLLYFESNFAFSSHVTY
jgi:hypothetical protein